MTPSDRIRALLRDDRRLWTTALIVAALTLANLLTCALTYEFTGRRQDMLIGPQDRFADLAKVSLSYRTLLPHVSSENSYSSWPALYRDYYENNPYGAAAELRQGRLTHFHLPPFSTLLFMAGAKLIDTTRCPQAPLWLFFFVQTALWIWAANKALPRCWSRRTTAAPMAAILLLSYPALLVFSRGNLISAGMTSALAMIFLAAVVRRGVVPWTAALALAVAINIKPNIALLLLAAPLALGLRRSWKPTVGVCAASLSLFAGSLQTAHVIYRDYTFASFRQGLGVYDRLYAHGHDGDAFTSSLLGLLKTLEKGTATGSPFLLGVITLAIGGLLIWELRARRGLSALMLAMILAFNIYASDRYAFALAGVMSLTLLTAVLWRLFHSEARAELTPFFLVALYCLASPVFADYHLLIFLAPISLLQIESEVWRGRELEAATIVLACVLMLSPKNYFLPQSSISLQLIVNPLITLLAVCRLTSDEAKLSANGLRNARRGV